MIELNVVDWVRDVLMLETAVVASVDESTFMVISYWTAPSEKPVTVTIAPSGKDPSSCNVSVMAVSNNAVASCSSALEVIVGRPDTDKVPAVVTVVEEITPFGSLKGSV